MVNLSGQYYDLPVSVIWPEIDACVHAQVTALLTSRPPV